MKPTLEWKNYTSSRFHLMLAPKESVLIGSSAKMPKLTA